MRGTLDFMAPEVLFPPEERTETESATNPYAVDIWAIGCMAFLMRTKKPPFRSLSQVSEYAKGKIKTPHFVKEMGAFSGPEKETVVSMLHWNPKERPSAAKVLEAEWMAEYETKAPMENERFRYYFSLFS
jgi:serine/threonine protein kinase